MGKTRIAAGVLKENEMKGRGFCLWVSCSFDLQEDLMTNLMEVRSKCKVLQPNKLLIQLPHNSVVFCTYNTFVTKKGNVSFVERIAELLGDQFDGLIVLDECHKAKNYLTKGGATKTSVAIITLQKVFKKARILYVSATAMTEPEHVAYLERLGLWGKGTRFDSADAFIAIIKQV